MQRDDARRPFNIHFETPSDANFYAAWTEADYRLIPPQSSCSRRSADVVLGCGYIFKFREKARKHVAPPFDLSP
jgi:hypothetical protein